MAGAGTEAQLLSGEGFTAVRNCAVLGQLSDHLDRTHI